MQLSSISCVLLAYNEERIIEQTIANATRAMRSFAQKDYEIIVVGFEGCSDRTNEIVQKIAAQDPQVRLVLQPKSTPGYGRALWIGLSSAKMDWIFQSDSDGQYDFQQIGKLIPFTKEEKIGLVHGYRKKRNDPMERVIMAKAYNFALRRLFKLKLRDIDSAFKLFYRPALEGITLENKSGFAITEVLLKIRAKGYKFRQLPVEHLPRILGEALSDKGVKNPLGLQLPSYKLVKGTLQEMMQMYLKYR